MARGRNHTPNDATRGVVTALVGFGIPQRDIAMYLAIDEKTLRNHYRAELDSGRVRANAAVISNFWKIASGKKGAPREQIRAAIWYLEKLSGLVIEPPSPDGDQPGEVDEAAYLAMTDAELARIAARGRKAEDRAKARARGRRPTGPVH